MLPQNNEPNNTRWVSNTRTLITSETRVIFPPGTLFKVLPNDLDNKIWLANERTAQRAFIADLSDPIWTLISDEKVQK